jgi:endonuclease/exonuclease/phosphatase family metal-dependent hydrolase
LKITSYNIQFGRGLDGEIDLVRIAAAIRGADIVCLQEVDQWWQRSGYCDQAAEIAGLFPTYYYVYGAAFDMDASVHSAHSAVINRRRRHGNMILSRWPIASLRTLCLPMHRYDGLFNMRMTCLEAVIDTGRSALRLYNCHAGYLDADERIAQMEFLGRLIASAPGEGGAWSGVADIDGDDWSNGQPAPPMPDRVVLCGDLNANPGSLEFGRLLDLAGLHDCWALADSEDRETPTRHREADPDVDTEGKIDHVLVGADLRDRVLQVKIDRSARGSDHLPVSAELDLA